MEIQICPLQLFKTLKDDFLILFQICLEILNLPEHTVTQIQQKTVLQTKALNRENRLCMCILESLQSWDVMLVLDATLLMPPVEYGHMLLNFLCWMFLGPAIWIDGFANLDIFQ